MFALALVVATACTTTSGGAGGDEPSESVPDGLVLPAPGSYRVLEDPDLLSPIVQLMGGGLRSDEFLNEVERATASCMQLRGWTYEPVLVSQPPEPMTVGEKRRQVTTYGYLMFSQPPSPPDTGTAASIRNNQRFQELGPQEQARYVADLDGAVGEGTPDPDSCRGQAHVETGSLVFHPAAQAEAAQLQGALWNSPEALAVMRAYADCMTDRGYTVQTTADAYLHARAATEDLPTQEAIALEIKIATDDFECQLPTRISWYHHAQVEIVRILTERYPELGRD